MSRMCLSGSCRPFLMDVTNCFDGTLAMRIERDYSCTMCCINRPVAKIFVYDDNNQAHFIGSISHVFQCCEYTFEIKNHEEKVIYNVRTPACQKALICNCPCQECSIVDFTIHDASDKVVTHARKEGKGFVKNALTNADNFNILFTPQMSWNHRALLLGSIIFLDYRMFEDKHKNEKNQRRNGLNL